MNNMPESQNGSFQVTRRDFVRNSSFAAAMLAMGGVPLFAADEKPAAGTQVDSSAVLSKVRVGVVGCGLWGRKILDTLATLPRQQADVIGVCEHYEPFLKRAKDAAPKAQGYTDYKKLIENPDVQAIIVATPSHQHKDIVLAALAANKHVYCEAPMATTVDDARSIAKAAHENPRCYFQAGLMYRADKHHKFVLDFCRSGATGSIAMARAQWHRKQTWRRSSPNAQREQELNWRLDPKVSLGLVGEVGVQQIDTINWFLAKKPIAVSGLGRIALHNDGREVDDTVQVVYEYADGTFFTYDATLANSFDADYEMLYGTDAAVMMRQNRAWMFKETDSPLLGWEVYARKESILNETGIVLMAGASKSTSDTDPNNPPKVPEPIQYTLETFLTNADLVGNAIEDYAASYDVKDTKAVRDYIDKVQGKLPAAGYTEGYESAVSVIKGAEAVTKRGRVTIEKDLYKI